MFDFIVYIVQQLTHTFLQKMLFFFFCFSCHECEVTLSVGFKVHFTKVQNTVMHCLCGVVCTAQPLISSLTFPSRCKDFFSWLIDIHSLFFFIL